MAYSFRGGIHPGTHADPGYKSATNTKPIEKLALPDEVILPVSMHIGAPAKPIVSVGDTVDLGQPIAEAGGFVSAPVHATVSGKVKAIEPRLHPNGSKVLSIHMIDKDAVVGAIYVSEAGRISINDRPYKMKNAKQFQEQLEAILKE